MTLQKLQIFRDLTEEEMQKSLVCSQAVTRTYQKNEYIFRQEDRPQKLYFILEGEVEVGSINLNGKITRMSMLAEGEYLVRLNCSYVSRGIPVMPEQGRKRHCWKSHRTSLEEDASVTVCITVR